MIRKSERIHEYLYLTIYFLGSETFKWKQINFEEPVLYSAWSSYEQASNIQIRIDFCNW